MSTSIQSPEARDVIPSINESSDRKTVDERPLFRVAKLTRSIGTVLTRRPIRYALIATATLIAAALTEQAILDSVDDDFVSPTNSINLDSASNFSSDPSELSGSNLRYYLISERLARAGSLFDSRWSIITTDPVRLAVNAVEGINVRDFPDDSLGKKDRVLENDSERLTEESFTQFVTFFSDEENKVLGIWASRQGPNGREFVIIADRQGTYASLVAESQIK